jgi:hypothetical protein
MTGQAAEIIIPCAECETPFTFSVGEQSFYARKGLAAPRRCRSCRDARRQTLRHDASPHETLLIEKIVRADSEARVVGHVAALINELRAVEHTDTSHAAPTARERTQQAVTR